MKPPIKTPMNRKDRRKAAKTQSSGAGAKTAPKNPPPAELRAQAVAALKAGRKADALKLIEKMLKAGATDLSTLGMAGKLALETGAAERAVEHLQHAVEMAPNRADLQLLLADALRAQGDPTAALAPHRRAVELTPAEPDLLSGLIRAHWAAEDTQAVPELCARLQALRPLSIEAMAHAPLAHYRNGDAEAAEQMLALDDLVLVRDLDAVPGWDSVDAFNRALATHVTAHPTMAVPDPSHPTYHNPKLHITDELLDGAPGPMTDLRHLVENAIADYRAERAALEHPLIRHWPEEAGLSGWATLLKGEGAVDAHVHLEGWLATVYYPELPPETDADPERQAEGGAGWLELGRPSTEYPQDFETKLRFVQPKEGRLVLFPGYLFHRTTPFQSDHRRISIAIDVVVRS